MPRVRHSQDVSSRCARPLGGLPLSRTGQPNNHVTSAFCVTPYYIAGLHLSGRVVCVCCVRVLCAYACACVCVLCVRVYVCTCVVCVCVCVVCMCVYAVQYVSRTHLYFSEDICAQKVSVMFVCQAVIPDTKCQTAVGLLV